MKKAFLLLFALVLFTGSVAAQGFYFRAGGSYALPVGTSDIGQLFTYSYDGTGASSVTKTSSKGVSASYGAGANISVAAGYKFNQNFMFDLGAWYLISNKYQTSSIYNYLYSAGNPQNEKDVYNTQVKGVFFNPAFVFSAGFGKAAPYGRFGIIVGSPQLTRSESYYSNVDGIISYDKTWVLKKGLGMGYQAAIGMNWKISSMIDIYTELNVVNMTW